MHPFIEIYIDLTRNTPPLVQLFFIFFGLASLGLRLDAMPTAILVLSLYSGAYQAEIIRAGIAAVPKSQHEAAASLGLTRLQAWSRVLLAQSLETMFPALKSQFVLALLSTSLVSVLAARELLFVANELAAETYRNFEIYIAATVIYLLVVLTFRCGITLIGIAAFSRQRRRALGAMRRLIPGYILSRAA
jgi:polar amino acid transport system permease protein